MKILSKGELTDAVDNSEVNGLCALSQLARYHLLGYTENSSCGRGVYIRTLVKGTAHFRISAYVRKHAKLYLGVIRIRKQVALLWNEELSHLPSKLCTYRNILQVRVGG